jgi:hypothetical protein
MVTAFRRPRPILPKCLRRQFIRALQCHYLTLKLSESDNMSRLFFVGGNWKCVRDSSLFFCFCLRADFGAALLLQNGNRDSISALVGSLNGASLPSTKETGTCRSLEHDNRHHSVSRPSDRMMPLFVVEIVVAPTFVHLDFVQTIANSKLAVAAQNCWHEDKGAFTGEVSFVYFLCCLPLYL